MEKGMVGKGGWNAQATEELKRAIEGRYETRYEKLLRDGADPGAADAGGWTLLHCAARAGWTEFAKRLLELGAPPDTVCRTSSGEEATPLALALCNGRHDIANLLLEAGASFGQISMGKTVSELAQEKGLGQRLAKLMPLEACAREDAQSMGYDRLCERLGISPGESAVELLARGARGGLDGQGARDLYDAAKAALEADCGFESKSRASARADVCDALRGCALLEGHFGPLRPETAAKRAPKL